jgi:hypothetical protein
VPANECNYSHKREGNPHADLLMVRPDNPTRRRRGEIPVPKLRGSHNLALREMPNVRPSVSLRKVRLYRSLRSQAGSMFWPEF